MFKYRVVFRRFEPHSAGCQCKMERSSEDHSLTESYLLNVTLLVLCGRVHRVQGGSEHEDGTARAKGKQANVWNGASLSDQPPRAPSSLILSSGFPSRRLCGFTFVQFIETNHGGFP